MYPRVALSSLLSLVGLACAGSPVRWVITVDDPVRDEVALFEAWIEADGCRGTGRRLYEARFAPGRAAPTPERLAPGTVGVWARARRRSDCAWFLERCVPVDVPVRGRESVTIHLLALDVPEADCAPALCRDGECGPRDGGAMDAAPDTAPRDSGIDGDGATVSDSSDNVDVPDTSGCELSERYCDGVDDDCDMQTDEGCCPEGWSFNGAGCTSPIVGSADIRYTSQWSLDARCLTMEGGCAATFDAIGDCGAYANQSSGTLSCVLSGGGAALPASRIDGMEGDCIPGTDLGGALCCAVPSPSRVDYSSFGCDLPYRCVTKPLMPIGPSCTQSWQCPRFFRCERSRCAFVGAAPCCHAGECGGSGCEQAGRGRSSGTCAG